MHATVDPTSATTTTSSSSSAAAAAAAETSATEPAAVAVEGAAVSALTTCQRSADELSDTRQSYAETPLPSSEVSAGVPSSADTSTTSLHSAVLASAVIRMHPSGNPYSRSGLAAIDFGFVLVQEQGAWCGVPLSHMTLRTRLRHAHAHRTPHSRHTHTHTHTHTRTHARTHHARTPSHTHPPHHTHSTCRQCKSSAASRRRIAGRCVNRHRWRRYRCCTSCSCGCFHNLWQWR
jgi:hypothetical protein